MTISAESGGFSSIAFSLVFSDAALPIEERTVGFKLYQHGRKQKQGRANQENNERERSLPIGFNAFVGGAAESERPDHGRAQDTQHDQEKKGMEKSEITLSYLE
jgi:hypothetical protein